jgi:hypothetical protein
MGGGTESSDDPIDGLDEVSTDRSLVTPSLLGHSRLRTRWGGG